MKKQISIFVHCFPPAKGGLEYLVGEIKKILDKKYTVHVITGRGMSLDSYKTFKNFLPKNKTDQKNNIHRLKFDFFWQRLANKLLNKIILKISFFSPFYFGPILKYPPNIIKIIKNSDLIIGTGMPTKMFYDSYLFAKKHNKKLILIPAYHNVSYYNNCLLFQKALTFSNKVLYLTPLEKSQLAKNYKINKNKLTQTTFCPYTKKQIQKQKNNLNKVITQKLKRIQNKQINIGFVGQITLRKNLIFFRNYLDKYLSYWQKKSYIVTIYLSGAKTNNSPIVEKQLKKHIKNKTVKINYNFKNKQKEYSKIDFFVNPSKEESLGIVNLEAIFNLIPTLVHEQSAFADFIPNQNIKNIDQLHQKVQRTLIQSNYKQTIKKQYSIFQKYNYDNFKNKLTSQLTFLFKQTATNSFNQTQ